MFSERQQILQPEHGSVVAEYKLGEVVDSGESFDSLAF
jgi:hypothetical protein